MLAWNGAPVGRCPARWLAQRRDARGACPSGCCGPVVGARNAVRAPACWGGCTRRAGVAMLAVGRRVFAPPTSIQTEHLV
ncbi:hypothetical protein COLSTE_02254 [Collinsella stercoris DSM 13279]|uniref:Uncharacterized protein n=1 Tax=Collinsella stercoris DSM 13279 TaxID=445975 RepID=B6GDS1_9ACTN|nr:hypothetical protein COLSTE_02254 [Collinsella stercoris DSM 13279]